MLGHQAYRIKVGKKHKSSFNNSKYRLKTIFSKYIWELKDKNKEFSINQEILARTQNKFNLKYDCTLCNMEINKNSQN